eukprot:1195004-Prorocentrum_minimum.AAC.3
MAARGGHEGGDVSHRAVDDIHLRSRPPEDRLAHLRPITTHHLTAATNHDAPPHHRTLPNIPPTCPSLAGPSCPLHCDK